MTWELTPELEDRIVSDLENGIRGEGGQCVEIYGLSDPRDGRVRYIGKARDSRRRLSTHVRDSRRRNTPVYRWIRKLLRQGVRPSLVIIEVVRESEWQNAERRHIAEHRKKSRLLNVANGGDEPHCPQSVLKANAERLKEYYALNPDARHNAVRKIKFKAARDLRYFREYSHRSGDAAVLERAKRRHERIIRSVDSVVALVGMHAANQLFTGIYQERGDE